MAYYFIRIELHDAPDGAYDELHEEMQEKHFYRHEGSFKYPDATYRGRNSSNDSPSAEDIRAALVRFIYRKLKVDSSVVVVRCEKRKDIAMSGLELKNK